MKPIGKNAKNALAAIFSTALMTLAVSAAENANSNKQQYVEEVSYDWHSNAKVYDSKAVYLSEEERKLMAARIAKHGRGAFICSPSGFGRLSRCHTR